MPIVIVTGPPGAGKTTVAGSLARSSQLGVHLLADQCFHWIASGYVPPWLRDSDSQNATVIAAIAAAAARFASGGYEVVVDGIVGPWFLGPFLDALGDVRTVERIRYVVLRPARPVALARAMARVGADDLVDSEPVDTMYSAFEGLGWYERYAVDTSNEDADKTVSRLRPALERGEFDLPARLVN